MPRENTPSWEERVVALEQQTSAMSAELAKKDQALADAAAAVGALKGELAAATAALEAQRQAQAARDAAEFSAYVDGLKKDAAAAGSPIPEADLEQVRETYQAGHKELAKTLGGAFLERAKALGGGSVRGSTTQTVSLGANGGDATSREDYAAQTKARWGLKTKN